VDQRNPQRVVELLMVTGVLLGSTLLVQILPVKYLNVSIDPVGRGSFDYLLLNPPTSILVFVIATLAISFEIGTSTSTGSNWHVILLLFYSACGSWTRWIRKRHIALSCPARCILSSAFAVICVLLLALGSCPGSSMLRQPLS